MPPAGPAAPTDEEPHPGAQPQPQPLGDTVRQILEEARMTLPGGRPLVGSRPIVVFNRRFRDRLSPTEQYLHLVAMALIAIAGGRLMAPAAYHRRAEPESVSRRWDHS